MTLADYAEIYGIPYNDVRNAVIAAGMHTEGAYHTVYDEAKLREAVVTYLKDRLNYYQNKVRRIETRLKRIQVKA